MFNKLRGGVQNPSFEKDFPLLTDSNWLGSTGTVLAIDPDKHRRLLPCCLPKILAQSWHFAHGHWSSPSEHLGYRFDHQHDRFVAIDQLSPIPVIVVAGIVAGFVLFIFWPSSSLTKSVQSLSLPLWPLICGLYIVSCKQLTYPYITYTRPGKNTIRLLDDELFCLYQKPYMI